MEVKHIFQENDFYCGPAVVQMVLARFGVEVAQKDIAKELETDLVVGTSARELQKFFEKRGFVVEQKNDATWEDVAAGLTKGAVIIGYIEQEGDPHYALVSRVEGDTIVLKDPTHGDNLGLTKEEFLQRWTDDAAQQYGHRALLTVSQSRKAQE